MEGDRRDQCQRDRRDMRSVPIPHQGLKPARVKQRPQILMDVRYEEGGRRDQREQKRRTETCRGIAGKRARQKEESHRAQTIKESADCVVGHRRRGSGHPCLQGDQYMKERRIGVLKRNPAIPEREPPQCAWMLDQNAADADVSDVDGIQETDVRGMENPRADSRVQKKKKRGDAACPKVRPQPGRSVVVDSRFICGYAWGLDIRSPIVSVSAGAASGEPAIFYRKQDIVI